MGKLPFEKKRAIFQILDTVDVKDLKGNFVRKKEWLNPNIIQGKLKDLGLGTIGRDEITLFLNECNEHEENYVDKRKPERKDPDSETKAQNEYKLLESGRALLEFMMNPKMDFIGKRIKD